MKIRINSIECRFSQGRYEIVKWQPNGYYGKREEYIEEGWVEVGGFFKKNNTSIQSTFFDLPETCYTVATLIYDKKEECCDMHTVGARLLDLKKQDRKDFFKVYKLSEKSINRSSKDASK